MASDPAVFKGACLWGNRGDRLALQFSACTGRQADIHRGNVCYFYLLGDMASSVFLC